MWPGSPGLAGAEDWDPQFLLLDILSGEETTFPYEIEAPR